MIQTHQHNTDAEDGEGHMRPVTLADAEVITGIYNYYIQETTVTFEVEPLTVAEMTQRINDISARFPYFVYEKAGKILGYCYVHQWMVRAAYSKTLETTVYVVKEAARQGIGSLMVRRLIELCREQGYHALIACITKENEASVRMHEKLGFHQASDFKEVGKKFGRWLDVVDLEYML